VPKSPLLQLDDLDSRREVHRLLSLLSPRGRVRFLKWACSQAKGKNVPVPRIARSDVDYAYRCGRADDRLTNTIFADLVALAAQWELDLPAVAVALEAWARGRHPAAA
jgi:hypothetical protein